MKDLSHFPKTDIRFWQKAVFHQPYTVDGQRRLTKEWYGRVQYGGKRQFFSLGTPNKAAAAGQSSRHLSGVGATTGARLLSGESVRNIGQGRFDDFVAAWNKVMDLDRFDLTPHDKRLTPSRQRKKTEGGDS